MTNEDKELKVAEFIASLRPSPNNCSYAFYHYFFYGDNVEIASPALPHAAFDEGDEEDRDAINWTLGRLPEPGGDNVAQTFVWEFWDSTLQGVIEQYLKSIGEL